MRHLAIGIALCAAPLSAATAQPWCPVPPDQARPWLASAITRLSPYLQSEPHPLAQVHTEGTLPHRGIRDESVEAERQLPLMRDAAFAWRAGAGQAYFEMARRYLDAWVATYRPDDNPIDETNFDALIDTYAVLAPTMDATSSGRARDFLAAWAKSYVAQMDAHANDRGSARPNRWNNNWQSHRVKLVTMIAVAIGDPRLRDDARRLFRAQVDHNIKPDGEVLDFGERDALHYVIYDLEPLTRAALAMATLGENWFDDRGAGGRSLASAFAWLAPYAAGEKPHVEFVHSTVAFDRQRADAGEKGYAGPFDPATAANAMWAAARFQPAYVPLAARLHRSPPTYIAMCGN